MPGLGEPRSVEPRQVGQEGLCAGGVAVAAVQQQDGVARAVVIAAAVGEQSRCTVSVGPRGGAWG